MLEPSPSYHSFERRRAPPHPHSFPTRRSSDLRGADRRDGQRNADPAAVGADTFGLVGLEAFVAPHPLDDLHLLRSEEHTSELQSHVNLVCRLLLEKKRPWRTRPSTRTAIPHPC